MWHISSDSVATRRAGVRVTGSVQIGLFYIFIYSNLWAGKWGWAMESPKTSRLYGAEADRGLWPDISSFQPIAANRSAITPISSDPVNCPSAALQRSMHLWICVGEGLTCPSHGIPDSKLSIFISTSGSDGVSLPGTPPHRLNEEATLTLADMLLLEYSTVINRKTATLTALGCFIAVTGERTPVHPAMRLSHMERTPSVEPLANRSPSGDHWRLQIPSFWRTDPIKDAGARRSWWWILPRADPL